AEAAGQGGEVDRGGVRHGSGPRSASLALHLRQGGGLADRRRHHRLLQHLHEGVPIVLLPARRVETFFESLEEVLGHGSPHPKNEKLPPTVPPPLVDRKSTRLNSSHVQSSYAVSCLKR